MIIRVEKDRDYTTINNTGLKDNRLSWGAKGFLAYLLSLPDDWKIIVEHLKTVSTDGRDSTISKIKELIDNGYMEKHGENKGEGKFKSHDYTIYEKPLLKNRNGKTVTENQKLLNTKEVSTKANTSKEVLSDSKKSLPKQITDVLKTIFPKGNFQTRLPHQFPDGRITKTVQKISQYLLALKQGRFFQLIDYDKEWALKNRVNTLKIKGVMTWEKLELVLNKTVCRYNKMKLEGYWPPDKRPLTRDFCEFLFNPMTRKSWFLYCLYNRPQFLGQTDVTKLKENISEEVKKAGEKLGKIFKEKDRDSYLFWKKLLAIEKWYDTNREFMMEVNEGLYNTGWDFKSYFGNFRRVLKTITAYAKTWDSFNLGNFGVGNKTWDNFVPWVQKEYGIHISASKEEKEKLKKGKIYA